MPNTYLTTPEKEKIVKAREKGISRALRCLQMRPLDRFSHCFNRKNDWTYTPKKEERTAKKNNGRRGSNARDCLQKGSENDIKRGSQADWFKQDCIAEELYESL